FQAEDGIRDPLVTGVQTCALPILIKKVAEYFNKGSVVLIGKIAVDAEQKIKILDDVPNVHFLGRKSYAELPAYCKGFDVALNPRSEERRVGKQGRSRMCQ